MESPTIPICKRCNDRGYFVYEDEDACKFLKECECQLQAKIEWQMKKSGLFDEFERCDLKKFKTTEVWQAKMKDIAERFSKEPVNRFLFMSGQVGCGKTMLSTGVFKELLKKGYTGKYVLWRQTLMKLKMLVNDETYFDELDKLRTVDVLYIDDFLKGGKEPTEADVKVAYDIINSRYLKHGGITILSTEYMLEAITDIDEAIGSRIAEKSKGAMIQISSDKNRNMRFKE